MVNLTDFNLINNKLDHLSKELTEMTRLRGLKIEGQNISELPLEMKSLVNLRTLSLNNNKFKKFPPVVLEYKKLYKLSIQGNGMESIPIDLISYLPDLEDIELDRNQLTIIPASIQSAKKLKSITFEDNPINFPPWIFEIIDFCEKNAEGGKV